MEIVKQSCNYNITDTLENGWKLIGNATAETAGHINIYYSVQDELGEEIGNCNYSKPANSLKINLGYNVTETKKNEFLEQSDSIITSVLNAINADGKTNNL